MTIYRWIYRSFLHFVTISTLLSSPSVSMFRSRNRFDHPLSFLSFFPPLITPEMIFFCAPLYIYAPFAIFLTSVLLSLSLWQKSLIYLISFYVSCIHFLVFDYAFYNLLKIFNFFKKLNFFKSNERKIIYLERLLYRITSFSVRDLFLKNRILQAILAIQPVCFTCMMKK